MLIKIDKTNLLLANNLIALDYECFKKFIKMLN